MNKIIESLLSISLALSFTYTNSFSAYNDTDEIDYYLLCSSYITNSDEHKSCNEYKEILLQAKEDLVLITNEDDHQIFEIDLKIDIIENTIESYLHSLIINPIKKVSLTPSSSDIGNKIAELAISRLDCMYWWGAPGGIFGDPNTRTSPNAIYFDCSGLVYWTHYQAGVDIVRTTASGYAGQNYKVYSTRYDWQTISKSMLQAGDVVTVNSGGNSTVYHIGIYIGNGYIVHAGGGGSYAQGNYPNAKVKVDKLSYFDSGSNSIYNYRRLY